jgi:Protein of unknown function (DUF1428)
MSKLPTENGVHTQIFLYRIPKKEHAHFKDVEAKLAKIYVKHGMLGSRTYQLGKTSTEGYTGFQAFDQALGISPSEEIWIETDFYPSKSEFDKIVPSIGQDQAAGPLWAELAQITGGRTVMMGEFAQLAKA